MKITSIILFIYLIFAEGLAAQVEMDRYLDETKYTVTFNFELNIQVDLYSNGQVSQISYYNDKSYSDSIIKFFREGNISLRAQLLSFELDSSYGSLNYYYNYSVKKYYRNGNLAFEGYYTDSLEYEKFYLSSGELYYVSNIRENRIITGIEKSYPNDSTQSQILFINGEKILKLDINYKTGNIIDVSWFKKEPRKYNIEIVEFDLAFYINLEELHRKL